jgi:asparagine synthase (glutamine-hydrolysing)
MSAISGILYFNGQPVDISLPERMTDCLIQRGPDGAGIWAEGPVAFGHRMLCTTHESLKEKLPLKSQSGNFVITSDARIDNREELIASLDFDISDAANIADSQLILAAYEKWGESCPKKLLGDFAFAIWDRRSRTIFCARDPIGVKPFYYYLSDRSFVFATEIKAIFCLPEITRRLNESRVVQHLLNTFEDKTSTFYEGILRLPPAHSITVGLGINKLRSYWSLDSEREIRLGSDREYAEAFREVFTSAVRCRLRSAFELGSTLSGGLDSSSIACTARKLLKEDGTQPLHTFSAIFPSLPQEDMSKIDERKFMESVLSLGEFESHFVQADLLSPLSNLDDVLWHEDEAVLAPNLYIHWGLYGAARKEGVRVFLDGLDGDSTVSHGLDYLGELARKGRWLKLYSESSALSRQSPNRSFTPRNIFWDYGIRNAIPEDFAKVWRALRRRPQSTFDASSLISKSFAKRVKLDEKTEKPQKRLTPRESHRESLDSAQIPYTLELADKASAAFGLESRYPFFDRRLIEFCVALPADQKLNQGWTRVVMRRAMEGILPKEVQWRIGKANLSPNFKRRLSDMDASVIENVIETESDGIQKYYDISALRASYKRFASEPMLRDQDAMTVYGAAMLGVWLRETGFDQESMFDSPSNMRERSQTLAV